MSRLRSAAALALKPVRRGRRVAWTPDFMGLGNLLQLAMWAYEGRCSGESRWIKSTAKLDPWLEVFPGLNQLVIQETEIRFTDRRVRPWSVAARAARTDGAVPLHEPLDMRGVERFIRDVMLPGAHLDAVLTPRSDILVVNVRRGDYYSDPEIRRQYGFEVAAYVRAAVLGSMEHDGVPTSILFVSDDIEWCRSNLGHIEDASPIRFADTHGAVEDFKLVSSARRVVLSNSTFSYWAAHVGNVLHGDNHAQVWAPRFFDRSQNGGRSWLLDERWSIIEELDGGWDEVHGS